MLFNSHEFLFVFLPLLFFALVFIRRVSLAKGLVVLASLFFYAWWEPKNVFVLLSSLFVNYFLAFKIHQTRKKYYLFFGVFFNLALIAFFKYYGFFSENLSLIWPKLLPSIEVVLPLAISFFTFQQIAFLVDLKNKKINFPRFIDYCFFVCFFPQLIAGPIVKIQDILASLNSKGALKLNCSSFNKGFALFFIGLFKKVVIADALSPLVSKSFNSMISIDSLSFVTVFISCISYTYQLYFDFSGYTDMAMGLGLVLGIKLPQNFNSPYKSESVIEFWRRWHMTLSDFLKYYLYIPLGGNRKGSFHRYKNLFLTMLLGGLWHGAGWTFVIWGALHGFYLIANHALRKLHFFELVPRLFKQIITFSLISFAWIFFRSESFEQAFSILEVLSVPQFVLLKKQGLDLIYLFALTLFVLKMPNTHELFFKEQLKTRSGRKLFWQPNILWLIIVLLVSISSVLSMNKTSEFLYFQF